MGTYNNDLHLSGNIATDIELRKSTQGTSVVTFSIAVYRAYAKNNSQENNSDFFRCVVFGKSAEYLAKAASKGNRISLNGHLRSSKYQKKDGTTIYSTDIVVESFHTELPKGKTNPALEAEKQNLGIDKQFQEYGFEPVSKDDEFDEFN